MIVIVLEKTGLVIEFLLTCSAVVCVLEMCLKMYCLGKTFATLLAFGSFCEVPCEVCDI